MSEGEQLFIDVTANTEQRILKERIRDIINSDTPIELITEAMMKQREKLRMDLLKLDDAKERDERLAMYYTKFNDFYMLYLKSLVAMNKFNDFSDIKAISFLSFYARYFKFLEHIEGSMSDFLVNRICVANTHDRDFGVQAFLFSGWDVYIYLMPKPLHTMYDMVEITNDSVIEETDWDGTKSKKGQEIIRRNGECGGKVFAFVHLEDVNSEENEQIVAHFYSVSVDGKEMRHYRYEGDV